MLRNISTPAEIRELQRFLFIFLLTIFLKECPEPCTRLNLVDKLIGREPSQNHQIILIFAPEVEVAKSVLTMTLLNLMSNLGGSLGLMLGLGLLQITEFLDRGINIFLVFCMEKKEANKTQQSLVNPV